MPVQTGAAGAAGKQGISDPTVLISKCSVINTKEGTLYIRYGNSICLRICERNSLYLCS